jgi:hypothetical protein
MRAQHLQPNKDVLRFNKRNIYLKYILIIGEGRCIEKALTKIPIPRGPFPLNISAGKILIN